MDGIPCCVVRPPWSEALPRDVYEKLRQIVYEKSGITLTGSKEALVTSRLSKRLHSLDLPDFQAYLRLLLSDEGEKEVVHLLDAISTNVTSFYREREHFDLLGSILSRWADEGQTRFRVWSAAASTGEEPYSLAITAREALENCSVDLRILATDISMRVLGVAMQGTYDAKAVDPVPPVLRERYFERCRDGGQVSFTVRPSIRDPITFCRLNLAVTPFVMKGPFDVVFCRNVMIYFDEKVRKGLLSEIYRLLRPGGYLMVGHAESLAAQTTAFRALRPSIYIKPQRGPA
jgi:chemotaxis protein methyltransferase CheR